MAAFFFLFVSITYIDSLVASVRIELTSAESESAIINRYTTRQYC